MSTPTIPTKSVFTSKTMAVNAVVLAASFVPAVNDWVTANPALALQILAGINALMRWITKGRVSLLPD